MQPNSSLALWIDVAMDIVQITLGGLMCLLLAIQFIKESLQMYRATRRLELSRYVNLLVREGMFYFIAYVHILLFNLFLMLMVDSHE